MKLKDKKVTRVLFKDKKGVTVFYTGMRPKSVPESGNFTIGADPFDTLKDAAALLKKHLLKVCGLNSVSAMVDSDALVRKMNPKEIKAFEKSAATAQAKRVAITGVTLAYDEEGKLLTTKLMGVFANEKGETFRVNAPVVDLTLVDHYGIEAELERDVLALLTEVEAFDNGDYNILEEPEAETEDPGDEEDEEEEETEAADEVDFDEPAPMKVVEKTKKKIKTKKAA